MRHAWWMGLALVIGLAGCAGPEPEPTLADELRARADVAEEYAAQWEAGHAQVAEGQEQASNGRLQLEEAREMRAAAQRLEEEGRANIAAGEEKVREGRATMERIEREHARNLPQSPAEPR